MFANNVLWHKTMAFLYFVVQRPLWMKLNWNYLNMWLIPGSEKKLFNLTLSQRTGLIVKLSGILKKEYRTQSEEGSSAAYYDLNNRDNNHNWLPERSRITLTSSIKMTLMEEKAKTKPNVGNYYYYLEVLIKLFILKPGSATVIKKELKV